MPALSQTLAFRPSTSVGSTATSSVVYPNTATTTQVYISDKVRGSGYYNNSGGLHTVMYVTSMNFIGTVTMQATLATSPGDSDWFDVADTDQTYTALDSERTTSSVDSYNFIGNYVWVRGNVAIDDGTVQLVQFNH
jgi:hypothetical protein